jgi:hypothetical protein
MIWNISRFKVFWLGLVGILCIYTMGIDMIKALDYFPSFEKIVLCLLLLQLIFASLFFLYWGLEPFMPELKWGEDR